MAHVTPDASARPAAPLRAPIQLRLPLRLLPLKRTTPDPRVSPRAWRFYRTGAPASLNTSASVAAEITRSSHFSTRSPLAAVTCGTTPSGSAPNRRPSTLVGYAEAPQRAPSRSLVGSEFLQPSSAPPATLPTEMEGCNKELHLQTMASDGRDRSRAGARPLEAGARAASNVMRVLTSLRKGYHVSGRHNPGVARRVFAIERDEPRLSFRIT